MQTLLTTYKATLWPTDYDNYIQRRANVLWDDHKLVFLIPTDDAVRWFLDQIGVRSVNELMNFPRITELLEMNIIIPYPNRYNSGKTFRGYDKLTWSLKEIPHTDGRASYVEETWDGVKTVAYDIPANTGTGVMTEVYFIDGVVSTDELTADLIQWARRN